MNRQCGPYCDAMHNKKHWKQVGAKTENLDWLKARILLEMTYSLDLCLSYSLFQLLRLVLTWQDAFMQAFTQVRANGRACSKVLLYYGNRSRILYINSHPFSSSPPSQSICLLHFHVAGIYLALAISLPRLSIFFRLSKSILGGQ